LYHLVPKIALPIHFFRHLLWDISFSHNTLQNNQIAEISAPGIAMGRMVTCPWLFQTRHFWAVRFCSYTDCRTQYDRPSTLLVFWNLQLPGNYSAVL